MTCKPYSAIAQIYKGLIDLGKVAEAPILRDLQLTDKTSCSETHLASCIQRERLPLRCCALHPLHSWTAGRRRQQGNGTEQHCLT